MTSKVCFELELLSFKNKLQNLIALFVNLEIRDYLRDTRKKLENKEIKLKVASDWKQAALVLDRTFFIIYFIITFSTIGFIFTRDPILRPFRTKPGDEPPVTSATTVATTLAADVLTTISNAVANVTSSLAKN